jgi:hypothetical protein
VTLSYLIPPLLRPMLAKFVNSTSREESFYAGFMCRYLIFGISYINIALPDVSSFTSQDVFVLALSRHQI